MHTFPNAPYFFTSRLFVTPSKVVRRAIYTPCGQASKSNLTVRYAKVCAATSNSDSFYKKKHPKPAKIDPRQLSDFHVSYSYQTLLKVLYNFYEILC